jgi:hypothetical protein
MSDESDEEEELDVEYVLEFKVKYIFNFDKDRAYRSCAANLWDPAARFEEVHGGQLCDVYQVYNILDEDPTPELSFLRRFVNDRGGEIYAERYDMNNTLQPQVFDHRYDILTVWTSKIAFDKWHFINDHLIDTPSMLCVTHGERHIDSHRMLHRVSSAILLPSEIRQNLFTFFKFEFPVSNHVMPRIRTTITHRQDNKLYGTDCTLDSPDLIDGYSAYGILYIFPPKTPNSIHPSLKPFKKEK